MNGNKEPKREGVDQEVGKFGMWVNDNIVGNPITFVLCIVAVVIVYLAIPLVGGYARWNTGLGLFFNTLSSSFELITGVGAVVGVVVLHKKHNNTQNSITQLHDKIDQMQADSTSQNNVQQPPAA